MAEVRDGARRSVKGCRNHRLTVCGFHAAPVLKSVLLNGERGPVLEAYQVYGVHLGTERKRGKGHKVKSVFFPGFPTHRSLHRGKLLDLGRGMGERNRHFGE
jgi:hypothetical protein